MAHEFFVLLNGDFGVVVQRLEFAINLVGLVQFLVRINSDQTVEILNNICAGRHVLFYTVHRDAHFTWARLRGVAAVTFHRLSWHYISPGYEITLMFRLCIFVPSG